MATANPIPTSQVPSGPTIQLHDIHTPEQVSNLPMAPGWWILLVIILISAVFFYKKHQKAKQLNAIKNQALTELNNNKSLNSTACISLIKWAAMHYFSRKKIAKLFGRNFQLFLMQQLPEKHQQNFKQLSDAGFALQYQADNARKQRGVDVEEATQSSKIDVDVDVDKDFQQAAKLWLSYALPVKTANAVAMATANIENDKESH